MAEIGRPTDYKEEYNEQVYKLCLLGAKDTDIANFFEVCEATINNWKQQFPAFLESIKRGKETADIKVAESLYNRACGYDKILESEDITEEVIAPLELDEKGKPKNKLAEAQKDFNEFKSIEDAKTVKYKHNKRIQQQHYAGDVTAQIFWLKNRQPKLWRDKQEAVQDIRIGDNLASVLKQIADTNG